MTPSHRRGLFIGMAVAVGVLAAESTTAAQGFAAAQSAGAERLHLRCFDVGDYAAAEEFYRWFDTSFKALEVLVNNAGIRRDGVVGMLSKDDWDAVLRTNLTGSFAMSKFALMRMLPNRYGRIINITSPSGRQGFEGQANYAASKAGQVALMRSLSKEVAKRRITVNCVSPGFIDTEFIGALPPEQLKAYQNSVPVKRFGQPAEVAHGVLFLASREAAYITGSVLEITGGL